MSLSQVDRKKLVIAAGVVVVAVVVLWFVVRGGKRQGPRGGQAGAGAFAPAGQTAGGAQTEAAPAPGAAAQQPAAAAQAEAAPVTVVAAGPGMLGPIRTGIGSEVRTRPDPFLTFQAPPSPPQPELVVNPPPVNLVAGGIRPVPLTEIAIQPGTDIGRNRVAGLMFDEGAYAILDAGGGQTFVVKPGDIVQGNLITAIARDSIYLVDAEGKRWQVQLRGLGPGGASISAPSSTTEGMPENPSQEF